jgi:hypothetical protein
MINSLLITAWELETGNAGTPVKTAIGLLVFISVPEGAVINRID